MPVSNFVSRLGITYLVNKIENYINIIKLFHFVILCLVQPNIKTQEKYTIY